MRVIMSNTDFYNWAVSLSGCDGGNIENASTWICGIEWGWEKAEEKDKENFYSKTLLEEIKKKSINIKSEYDFKKQTSRYDRSFAKLYTAIKGDITSNYEKAIHNFGTDEVFKLNLYPISFSNVGDDLWNKYKLSDVIQEFDSKQTYRLWCLLNRFPYFSSLTSKYRPKVIICTGTDYLTEFIVAFKGDSKSQEVKIKTHTVRDEKQLKNPTRTFYHILTNGGSTHQFVIPFFSGKHGLNSGELLNQMGQKIRSIADIK